MRRCPRIPLRCLTGALLFILAARAKATPYASGITNASGQVSWVLNETASDVKILFDNGTTSNDLGTSAIVGTNLFTIGSHTNFAIVVLKYGSNAVTQISSDGDLFNSFGEPCGVAVNTNSRTCNFGRIYVANCNDMPANQRGATTRGIFVMDAASEDFLGQGNTAATAGMTLASGTSIDTPHKLGIGPDDALYVGDAGSGKIGGLWRLDANLATATNIFNLVSVSSVDGATKGTNYGRVIGTPNVSGSVAGENLVLTATMWDLDLGNPPGTYGPNNYQDIYRYGIGSGPLPWKTFPTVVTNPIGIGSVNTVTMDARIAPDGKYFIAAYRYNPAEGTTNICVLNSAGSTVLWDSKTQSESYFNDPETDHLDFADTSISVSADDKYVLIQGSTNTTFLLMSLTNGVPDISTLRTNMPAATSSGTTCWASTWDAADNIYVTSAGSQYLRVFSLGSNTTCTTSNDLTFTNGGFSMSMASAAPAVIQTQPASQATQCGSVASFSVIAHGQALKYQWIQVGTGGIAGATNAALVLSNLGVGESSYQVVVGNSFDSVTSQVAVLTVVDTVPPVVTLCGSATTNLTQGTVFVDPGASAVDACAGAVSVRTNGTVNVNVAGTNYIFYVATDPSGNSATNVRTIYVLATNGPPEILQQPSNEIAPCTGPGAFSVVAYGGQPLSYQWYANGAPISGATSSNLFFNATAPGEAGSYAVVASNSFGAITSSVVTLSVNDSTFPSVNVAESTVVYVTQGSAYADAGATASDPCVGSLPVTTSGSVNVNVPGTYILTYSATNGGGNWTTAQRTVTVVAPLAAVAATAPNIIPLPVTLQTRPGIFLLCPPQPPAATPARALMRILVDAASLQTGQYLAAALYRSTGCQFQLAVSSATNAVRNAILITTSNAIPSLGAEGYELTVAPDSAVIRAPAQGGAFYGAQTFLQLLPPQVYSPRIVSGVQWAAPCVYIEDYPQYSWRGLMLDVSRHFLNKQEVKQVIDAMAMHKLNTLHWHLADDQGWRLQITNYPALTTNSAWRAGIDYGLPPRASTATNLAGQYGGYYTQADAREVVDYARQRHITVVPEIEMPCHATALLAAYPQFGCGNSASSYNMDYPNINYGVDLISPGAPGTMAFLEDVLTEVMGVFPSKYIHCGGDEVVSSGDTQWNNYNDDVTNMEALGITPNGDTSIVKYQYWFSTNLAAFLRANGRVMMGWTEFENGGIVSNAALADWETGSSSKAAATAEAGQPVVMAPETNCYFNYVEAASTNIEPPFIVGGAPAFLPLQSVYEFNPIPPGLPAAYDTNILGAEGTLFAEYVPSLENTLFKLFPRGAAMAEATWTPAASQNFSSFTNRLTVQEQRFNAMGINYDHESVPQIGSWGPSVSTSPTTVSWNITSNVIAAGEYDVNFVYTNGADGLFITSVALLQNGAQVDIDAHTGFAGDGSSYTLYILHLPETKPNATYTIQAVIAGYGGTASSGIVYLPNWN